MEKQKRVKKRKKNFFMAILVLLILKVFVAKADIFGFKSIGTGFFDLLFIAIAAYLISSLPTKNRLLAYSLFSFCLGFIFIAFKSRVEPLSKVLSPFTIIYFIDSLFIFSIYLLVRTTKNRRTEIVPKHSGMVYVLLLFFSILSIFNIVSVKAADLDAFTKARRLGIIAYSVSNPTIYIKADSLTPPKSHVASSGQTEKGVVSRPVSPTITPTPPIDYNNIANGKNVIVIQWESLQSLPVERTFNNVEITPNLNALIKESVYFKNGISQISKGTTSDAEFAFNTSCYPINNDTVFKTMANREYVGLPYLMGKSGYFTATFHTNTATFWNRANMYPLLGWEKWYDKPFFGKDFRAGYGSADYLLFKKALPELISLKNTGKPFFVQLITVSSHNPYTIPDWMRTVHFGSNIDSTYVGKYLRSINYADRQIGMFMRDLKESGLYDDSLIVLYGDHFGLGEKNMAKYGLKNNLKIIEKVLGRPYDKLDTVNVPILFKMPGNKGEKTEEMPAGQVDIMPTILGLTGVRNTEGRMFGSNLMEIKENQVGVRYYLPNGSFANNNNLFVGNEYRIDYKHKITGVDKSKHTEAVHTTQSNLVGENEAIMEKITESDAYVKGLKPIK